MLSEILFASVPLKREPRGDRVPGLSISQLFPCPYRLYKTNTGEVWAEEMDPRQILNAEDGWNQEQQSVERLAKAGIKIEERQKFTSIGKSGVPGHIDGTFILNGKKRLWEHKAWGNENFSLLTARGLEVFPGAKAQINGYMLGMGLDECSFFVKRKENNDYFDPLVHIDEEFILQIVEWCDRIRLERWEPKPELTKWCSYCGLGCFGPVIDFSWIKDAKADEMVEKWKKGKAFRDMGDMLIDEARTYFVGKKDKYDNILVEGIIGDRDLLMVSDLEIKRIIQHRADVDRQKVLQELGPDGLMRVLVEKRVVAYRIREV